MCAKQSLHWTADSISASFSTGIFIRKGSTTYEVVVLEMHNPAGLYILGYHNHALALELLNFI